MTKKEQKKIRNPAQALGEFLVEENGAPILFTSFLTAVVAGASINVAIDNYYDVLPDDTGTVAQETLASHHTERLSTLKQQKIDLEKAKAELTIDKKFDTLSSTQEQDLETLKSQFAQATKNTLANLHLEDVTKDGAALSEQNFDKLYTEAVSFLDKHEGQITGTGYKTKIEAGLLDECLIDVQNGNSQALNQCMAEHAKKVDIVSSMSATGGGITAAMAAFFLLLSGGTYLSEKLPKRISLRRPKNKLPTKH